LSKRAGDRDGADGEEILEMKVKTDAEHQEDDTDLGELRSEMGISLESGRMFAQRDAGGEVADNGGEPQAFRYQTKDQRGGEPEGERGDERDVVHGEGDRVACYAGVEVAPRIWRIFFVEWADLLIVGSLTRIRCMVIAGTHCRIFYAIASRFRLVVSSDCTLQATIGN
jgi:hypothetical protein